MKRITLLMSIGLMVITVSPLAAQETEPLRWRSGLDEAMHELRVQERGVNSALNSHRQQITLGTPFWRNAEFAKVVGLTADQQKKMEDIFQQHRLKLIDLNGSLVKEESVLSALMSELRAEEETRILAQIDRIAEIRAELEKTNTRMLFGFRQVLTPEQWSKLSMPRPALIERR
jgi:Spy/CpxP family protein refolding chaperone